MQHGAAAGFSEVPALNPARRCTAVAADTESPAERHLLRPAAAVLLEWRSARSLRAVHWFLFSLALGLIAGLLLVSNGSSPLFRFWAGVFLLGSEVLGLAGLQLSGARAFRSSHAEILRGLVAILIGFLFVLGATSTAAILAGSILIWPLGIAAGVSIVFQSTVFEGAKRQYQGAAGGTGPNSRENLIEIAVRRQKAVLRGNATEELIWRSYGYFRRMQQKLLPREPAGSADRFWRLNRRRMMIWVILGRRMIFVWLASAAIASAFAPAALLAALGAITVAGSLLLLLLRTLGWKSSPSRA